MRPLSLRVPLSILLVALALVVSLLISAGPAFGAPSSARTYEVQAGDTLYGIAAKLDIPDEDAGAWVKQVIDLNDLNDSDMLKVGAKLSLPDADKIASQRQAALIANAPAARTYTVQDGDTLSGIADASGVPVGDQPAWIARVLTLNDMDEDSTLRVGQKLQLPDSPKGPSASGLTLKQVSATTTSSQPTTTTYTVKDGDTLSSIADAFGVSDSGRANWIDQVLQLNSMDSADWLVLGQTLKVPVTSGNQSTTGASSTTSTARSTSTYIVKAGDTLYSIADSTGVKDTDRNDWINELLRLNNLTDANSLQLGQSLTLPASSGSSNSNGSNSTSTSANSSTPSSGTSNASTSSSSGGSKPSTPPPPASTAPPPGAAIFTVQPGDNLFMIAARLGIPVDKQVTWIYDVMKLNKLPDATSLRDGQRLIMPATTTRSATTTPPASSIVPTAGGTTGNPSPPPPGGSNNSSTDAGNSGTGTNSGTGGSTSSLSTTPTSSSGAGTSTIAGTSTQRSCFYVVQAADDWDSIARRLGISASKRDAWIAQVKDLNGIGAALPIGDAIRLPCSN